MVNHSVRTFNRNIVFGSLEIVPRGSSDELRRAYSGIVYM